MDSIKELLEVAHKPSQKNMRVTKVIDQVMDAEGNATPTPGVPPKYKLAPSVYNPLDPTQEIGHGPAALVSRQEVVDKISALELQLQGAKAILKRIDKLEEEVPAEPES